MNLRSLAPTTALLTAIALTGPAQTVSAAEAPPSLAPTAEPATASTADPGLVERNRKLSQKMQSGERKLIAGRLMLVPAGLLFVGGTAMGAVGGRNDRNGLLAGGVVAALAGAGLAAGGVVLMLRGKKEIDAANRGELSLHPTLGGAALRLRF